MIKKRFLVKGSQICVLSLVLLFLGIIGVNAQNWPAGVHDPSRIIKEGDTYWTFTTGNGVRSLYSTDMVTWAEGPTPFTNGAFPAWILDHAKTNDDQFNGHFWAPDIIHMNNQYYLYYSASVWGTMNSCIGLVINKTLDPNSSNYEWIDQGSIGINSPDFSAGGTQWTVNAIDPAVMMGPDGKAWFVYGSFNIGGIKVMELDTITGVPFGDKITIANSYTPGAANDYFEGEGASMFYRDGYYYLIYNKGGCCDGLNSSYYMVMGRSESPMGPFVDKEGKNMKNEGNVSGGTLFFSHDKEKGVNDRYYGPGHFSLYTEDGIDYVTFHYYDPIGNGRATHGLGMLEWDEEGWPTITFDFIEDGIYSLTNVNSGKALDLENHSGSEGSFLWQYPFDNTLNSQKWLFTAVGNGEYTIQNYSNFSHINVDGQTLATEYSPEPGINQKFRVIKGTDDKILVYPTTSDEVFEIPNAYTDDYQVKLWVNTNHACQRWTLTPWDINVTFSSAYSDIDLGFNDTTFLSDISIVTDGAWSIKFEDASWLVANNATGEGDFSDISIQASLNPTKAERTNKIFICSNTGEIDTAYVTQAPNPSIVFKVDVDNIALNYTDTSFIAFNITTNVPWNITYETRSWIEAIAASGDADSDITLQALENERNAERTNKIYINSASGEVHTVNVTQAGQPTISGISHNTHLNHVKVYPNPSSEKVIVGVADNARVNVYNSIGQQMFSSELINASTEIDISHFESGFYIFEIVIHNDRIQRKIIKP